MLNPTALESMERAQIKTSEQSQNNMTLSEPAINNFQELQVVSSYDRHGAIYNPQRMMIPNKDRLSLQCASLLVM